jgi:hypothetical protein
VSETKPESPSLETRLREMAACDCGQESLGRAEHASYCQTRGARAQAMVEAAERIVSLHQQLAEADVSMRPCAFCSQPVPHLRILSDTPICTSCAHGFRRAREAAEARIATLEQQLRQEQETRKSYGF